MRLLKWEADIIRDLHTHECCQVRGFIIYQNVRPTIETHMLDGSRIAWKVACLIEALLFHSKGITVDKYIDIEKEFEQTPKLLLTTDPEKPSSRNRFRDADIEKCRNFDCDILINFGLSELHGDILGVPRLGIWSYHFADNRVNKGMPPGFWEFYYDDPVTGVTLQSADLGGGKVLARGFYQTNRYSWRLNAESIYVKGSHLLMDKVMEFCQLGDVSVIREEFPDVYGGLSKKQPHVTHCIIAITKTIYRSAGLLIEKLVFRHVWELIISRRDRSPLELGGFDRVKPPRGRFWADPFIMEREGGVYVFLEEYKFRSKKGEIAVIKMEGVKVASYQTVISVDYHLSFPYIFEFEGELFMCPETSENNTVEVWKCNRFPDVWKKERELLKNVSAADTVIFQYCDKWWLFTNIDRSERKDHCYELWAFYADHPINGPWIPHGRNPLIVDTRCARNAGKVRWYDGLGLVRLSQINKRGYGSGIDIRRITKLDDKCYDEESIRKLRPIWDKMLIGLHHCDVSENYVVFDVCRKRLRLFS